MFGVAAKVDTSPTVAVLCFLVSEVFLPSIDYQPTVDFLLQITFWGSLSPVDKQFRLLTQAAVSQVA